MLERLKEILRDSRLSMNYIPSGQQLPRTPPLLSVKKHLDFCNDDVDYEEPQQNMEADSRDQDDNNQNTTFDFNTIGTKADEPNSMLKGMKGYQLTPTDLEFIEKMKVEKHIKKLQGDLEEVQRLLKSEMKTLELASAFCEEEQAKLENLPSCEDLTEWVKVVLKMTSPSTEVTGLDAAALLAMVTKENVQRATEEKRIELAQMKKMAANKRRREAKERGQLEKQLASEQLKIQGLMSQLSDLKSELAQQEESYKALEMQINTQEAPETTVEEVDTSEELQATKTQARRRGKGRKKVVKSTEKLQDTTNQSKSRSKLTDSQTSEKMDHANKKSSETLKMKQKSGAAAKKPLKSIKEEKVEVEESNSQESVRAVRGRRKPPGPAQPKNQNHVKAEETLSMSQQAAPSQGRKQAAGEEAPNIVLRRSKRIASRS